MSTSQRIEVVNEHRRKAANGSMLHRRIADWVKQSSTPKHKHSFSKRRKSHSSLDSISLEFQERKNGSGGLNDSELGGESNQKRMEKQYFWDFNTVEQVLISCAILTCLAGVMFESDRFKGSNNTFGWQGEMLTYLTILVIFFSIVYYICVVSSEICGCTPKWIQKLLAKKQKHHHQGGGGVDDSDDDSDDDDDDLYVFH